MSPTAVCAVPGAGAAALARPFVAMVLAISLAACASPLRREVEAVLGDPVFAGTHWGLMITTLEGEPVFSLNADRRFTPASNTKMLVTAAAFHRLKGLDAPDAASGASLHLEPDVEGGPPDAILSGHGDATLSDRADCISNCLAMLADALVRQGAMVLADVIGDDRHFQDERWSPGWSWNNLQTRSGTAVSALTVNSNEVAILVRPGLAAGEPAAASWRPGDDVWPLVNEAVTVADGETDLRIERLPGAEAVRIYGVMQVGASETTLTLGLNDPALVAASRLRRLLEQRGVAVEGKTRVRHRPPALSDDPTARVDAPVLKEIAGEEMARAEVERLVAPPLIDDLRLILKASQNVHAELLLRRLGRLEGAGSVADGLLVVRDMLREAGIADAEYDFADGSGMSTYNRVTPAMMTRFLAWTADQPWGDAWRDALPVGGVDGTLARRFRGSALEGRVFAKTGSLNAVHALSGFLVAASGRTLIFSAYANNHPSGAPSGAAAIDAALLAVAARR